MGILDALSGRISHSNSMFVPVRDSMLKKVKELENNAAALLIVTLVQYAGDRGAELVFGNKGLVAKRVKEYNQGDVREVMSAFVLWATHDLIGTGVFSEELLKSLQNVLGLDNEKFESLKKDTAHDLRLGELNRFAKIIFKILNLNSSDQHNFNSFKIQASRLFKNVGAQTLKTVEQLHKSITL